MLNYFSVCSGIEAVTVALERLGFQPLGFAEIDPFPSTVLAHHYPKVKNHGDFTNVDLGRDAPGCNLLAGGTPCQGFSIAGLRGGLADDRSNLALQFVRLALDGQPEWLLWENVPGVFSSKEGQDFACFLSGLSGREVAPPERRGSKGGRWLNSGIVEPLDSQHYGLAWRVLDAQYFGVPQRRRRVFVVGCLGDWRSAAAVLFEQHSLSGDTAPRREKGQGLTTQPARSVAIRGRDGVPQAELGDEVANAILTPNGGRGGIGVGAVLASTGDISHCLNAGGMGRQDYETETLITHSLRGEGFDASEDGTGRGTPLVPITFTADDYEQGTYEQVDVARPLTTSADRTRSAPIAIQATATRENPDSGPDGIVVRDDGQAYTLEARSEVQAVAISANQRGELRTREAHGSLNGTKSGKQFDGIMQGMAVRRLTPRECERLQGFPDDYTQVPYRGKPAADGPRYKAIGNSMAVPVIAWIGRRLLRVVEARQHLLRAKGATA